MRRCLLIVALLAIQVVVKAQQDPQFSQNMFNHMTVNPAFAGVHGKWMVSGAYRNQWQKMDGAPETYAFNVDAPLRIKGADGGIGLSLMSDKLGLQNNLHVGLNYAYRRESRIGDWSVGAKLGMVNAKIKGDFYIPGDTPSNDPALGGDVSKVLFDVNLGAFLSGKAYYAGIALSHLTKPKMTMGQTGEFFLARHMYLTGGYCITLTPKLDLQPSLFIITDFVSAQYTVNSNFVFNKMFWGGLSYRYEEALVFMAGAELKNGMAFGYSYDWNVSNVGKYTGGTHEVTLSYSFGLSVGKRQKMYKSVRFL